MNTRTVEGKGQGNSTGTAGTEGGRSGPTGVHAVPVHTRKADPHVSVIKKRRNLTVAFKQKVLVNVKNLRSKGFGKVGAYLRKIGIYYSTIKLWERQLRDGILAVPRGRKEQSREALLKENKRLRTELEKAKKKLHQSELIIDLQKKISDMATNSLSEDIVRTK